MTESRAEWDLETATWKEAEAAIEESDCIALPCGSTEQHSHHLPLSVDSIRAKELTAEIADSASEVGLDIGVLPTLPYGYSEHHMNYAGTITLSWETYIDVIVDIGRSLARHGASNLLIVNCHGGNTEPHKLAIDKLQREEGLNTLYVHWTDFARTELEEQFGTEWGHAGEYETSQIEYYAPELVREEEKKPQTNRPASELSPYRYFEALTDEGGLGNPTRSDVQFIEDVIQNTTERILQLLRTELEDNDSDEKDTD